MKNLQKAFILPTFLVVITLLVIGGIVYVGYFNKNKKLEAPVITYNNKEKTDDLFPPTIPPTEVKSSNKKNSDNNNPISIKKRKSKIDFSQCLPSSRKLDDVVNAKVISYSGGVFKINKTTIDQKLTEINASCNDNKLIDFSGKEIVFYDLDGCWGTPPFNSEEIMSKQYKEQKKLQEKYTVIQMTCNPSGISRP